MAFPFGTPYVSSFESSECRLVFVSRPPGIRSNEIRCVSIDDSRRLYTNDPSSFPRRTNGTRDESRGVSATGDERECNKCALGEYSNFNKRHLFVEGPARIFDFKFD